ncbi:hypothetical protein O6H91_06G089300 [Diphasiastrum complanatum]|uniref:Uncharacterized protein n=1 Tax=Diphasiastrum complanatum TaxID=34168 RepID=A0ACC2DGD9_DIPCM|nr:hypothetical protein O6H91_06G089300 [Diphasiastrum complanatum]
MDGLFIIVRFKMATRSSALRLPTYFKSGNSPIYSSKQQGLPQHFWFRKPTFESRVHSIITQASREDTIRASSNQQGKEAEGEHQCALLNAAKIPCGGLAKAARYACNDALFVSAAAQTLDERARSDLTLLAQEFSRLDMRARQDVALLGSGFLKLDARAREDAEKLDTRARRKVQRLKYIAMELAGTELKIAAAEHWNDGALEADLRLADLRARRRALEDSFTTFQAVKNIHVEVAKVLRLRSKRTSQTSEGCDASSDTGVDPVIDRAAMEDLYWSISTVLADVEGIDFSDPDELEFIVATLLDMDEVDGASGASLVMQCANSPDVATRLALADALADAPSFWTLGNAGICALQRLAKDSNSEVASAARTALEELEDQWRRDQDMLLFPQNNAAFNKDSVDELENDD